MSPPCLLSRSALVSVCVFVIGVQMPVVIADHYPHDYQYIINHPEACYSSRDIQLLLMVHSACSNADSRVSVRHTWGSLVKRRDVRLLFLLGSTPEEDTQLRIMDEDRTFGDIVQEDFLDTYHNLTLKTIMMVKWVTTYCPNARFALKIDDDCFMNPDNVFEFLGQNLPEVAIFGRVWRNAPPYRSKSNKWYMPYDMYPAPKYPDFASGPSYLLTQKAVPLLYAAALTTKYIHLEDVYLNGICAQKAKVPRVHKQGLFLPSSEVSSVKNIRMDLLTSHDFPRRLLQLMWWLMHDSRGSKLDPILTSGGQKTLSGQYRLMSIFNWT